MQLRCGQIRSATSDSIELPSDQLTKRVDLTGCLVGLHLPAVDVLGLVPVQQVRHLDSRLVAPHQ